MALGCINVLSPEFLDLKKQTGLNEHILAAKIQSWQDRNNRELDEFPTADDLEITTSKAPLTEVKKGVSELFESNPELAEIGTEKQYSEYLDNAVDNPSSILTFSTQRKIDDEKGLNKLLNIKDTTIRGAGEVTRGDKKEIRVYDDNIKYGDKSRPFGFNTDSEINNYLVVVNTKNKRTYTSSSSNLENSAEILNKYNIPLEATEDILILNELREELKRALASKSTAVKETHSKKRQDLQQYKEEVFKRFKEITPQNVNIILNEIGVVKELKTYYLPKNSKDILVLGSKQDIQGFKEFVSKTPDIAFSRTKDSIENKLKIFFNQFGFQYKEGDSSTDLLNKIIYTNKNDSSVFINNSVKALGQLVLANTNVDFHKVEALIEDTPEFKKLLSDSSDYIKKTHKFLKDGNRIPMEEWVSYIKEYNKIKNQVLGKYIKESLLDKNNSTELHKVINDFIQWFKDLFNNAKSLKEVTDTLVQQVLLNQKEIVINSKDLKNREQVTLNKALEETAHGKDIIKTFGEFGLILTGSVSAAEQGTVFRKIGKLLHDIDWVVPKGFNKDFNKKLKDTYPGSTLVREFDSPGYYTQTYIVPPKGHTISNLTFFKPEIHGKTKYIASYDVLDKNGNVVSNYRRYYDVKPSGKVVENREVYNEGLKNVDKDLEAVSVDFFQNKEDMKYMPYTVDVEGVKLQLSNWLSSFTQKLKYGRAKDLLDYAAFIPNDRIKSESKVGQPIKVFRTSRAKDGQKEYDLDKKPKGKSTETELIIDPTRTLDITQAQESGIANNDMLVYEQILREAKYEYDYLTSDTYKQMSNMSPAENIGAIVKKKALEKGYEGIIQYKDPYASNVQAIRNKGRKYTKFGSVNPNQIDLDDAKEWLESRGIPFDMSEQTIEIAKGMPSGTEGLFSEGVIYLSQYATKGTEYHEAFHAVFRMFLTDQQQDAILAESKKQQPVTQQELDELEEAGYFKIGDDGKIYKNIDLNAKGKTVPTIISKEELERLILEERLAEQFRSYIISNQKVKSNNSKIQNFFDKLLKFIKYYFSNKMTIDRLFHNIETGRINKKNLNKRYASKGSAASFNRNDSKLYTKFDDGQINNIVNDINSYFIMLNKVYPTDTPNQLYDIIRNKFKKTIFIKDGKPLTSKEVDLHINNLKELLNDNQEITPEFTEYMENEKLKFFKNNVGSTLFFTNLFWEDASADYGNLEDRGILYKAKIGLQRFGYKVYGDDVTIHEDQDVEEKIYDKSHLEENRKDTLSKDIKEFLTFIPVIELKKDENGNNVYTNKKGLLGNNIYYTFDEVYSNVSFSLTESKDYNEMMDKLEQRSKNFPEIQSVLTELKAKKSDEEFKSKFYAAMANTYNNFIGAIEEVITNKEGTKMGVRVRYYNSNLNNAEKKLLKRWKNNSRASDGKGLLINSDENETIINEEILDKLNDTSEDSIGNVLMNYYNRKSRNPKKIPTEEEIDAITEFANLLGMDIPRETFELAFNNGIIINNEEVKAYDLFGYLTGGPSSIPSSLKLQLYENEGSGNPVATMIKEDANGYIKDPYTEYLTIIKKFALISASFEKNIHGSFINAANKSIHPINLNTSLDRIITSIKTYDPKSTKFWDNWLREFKEDPFYMPSKGDREESQYDSLLISEILSSNSNFINNIIEISDFDAYKKRNEFVTKNTFDNLSSNLSLIHRLNAFGNNGSKKEMLIVIPTLADRGRMIMMTIPRLSHEFINTSGYAFTNTRKLQDDNGSYSIMMRYVVQDINDAQNAEKMTTKIKNYSTNYKFFRQLQFLNETEAGKKLMEYSLANPNDQLTKPSSDLNKLMADVQSEIDKYVKNQIEEKLSEYKSEAGSSISAEALNMYDRVSGEKLTVGEKETMFIKDYVVNTMIFKNEIQKITSGDPGLYKDSLKSNEEQISTIEDQSKRYGGLGTPGTEFRIQDTANSYGSKPTYTMGVINDIFRKNEKLLESLDKIVTDKSVLDAYKNGNKSKGSNVADAMGLVTLDRYRHIAQGIGMWPDLQKEAYANYQKNGGRFVDNKGKQVKLKPLKTYSDGLYLKDFGNGVKKKVRILVKHSTFPLLAEFTKGTGFDNIRMRMEVTGVFEGKGLRPIDEINMDSAIKSGLHNDMDLELDNDGNPSVESLSKMQGIELDTHFLRMPQIIPDTAKDSRIGSQFMKLLITNLKKNFDNPYVVGDTVITGKELYEKYGKVIELQLEMGVNKIFNDLGIPKNENGEFQLEDAFKSADKTVYMLKKIRKLLNNSIEERELPDTYLKALNIVKVEESNEKDYDFSSPLSMPAFAEKFVSILQAASKRAFMKININGQGLVQIAEIGTIKVDEDGSQGLQFIKGIEETVSSNELEKVLKYEDPETKEKVFYEKIVKYNNQFFTIKKQKGDTTVIEKIVRAEIAMPWEFAEKLNLPKDENGNFDISNIPENVLELIGYRIPTQGKNSMLPLKIVKILPKSMSKMIMVPAEITTQMGSDFDIDKLFTMIPNLNVKGTLKNGQEFDWFNTFKDEFVKKLPKSIKLTNRQISSLLKDTEYYLEIEGLNAEEETAVYGAAIEAKEKTKNALNNLKEWTIEKVKYDLNDLDSATKQGLENAYIDLSAAMLTSPYHIDELLKTIDSPLAPELANFFKTIIPEYDAVLDANDVDTERKLEERNKSGSAGIGIWATSTTGQAGRQFTGVKIGIPYIIDGIKYQDLTITEDNENNDISYQLQQHLTISVDNAKDPVMLFLMDNAFTTGVRNSIISLGFADKSMKGDNLKKILQEKGIDIKEFDNLFKSANGDSVVWASFFLNQPIIRKLYKDYIDLEGTPGKLRMIADKTMTAAMRNVLSKETETSKPRINDYLEQDIPLNSKTLVENFDKSLDNKDIEFNKHQLKVLGLFIQLFDTGNDIAKLNKIINSDRMTDFNNPAGIEAHLNLIDYFERKKVVTERVRGDGNLDLSEKIPTTKIISGAQTGIDQLGLEVGQSLGFLTGGTATPGFVTEKGKDTSLSEKYNVKEISKELQSGKKGKEFYLPRTEENAKNSDGTVYFATSKDSAGRIATEKFANKHGKPFILNPTAGELRRWLIKNKIKTLNVAGNRESKLSNNEKEKFKNTLQKALGVQQQADVEMETDAEYIPTRGIDDISSVLGKDGMGGEYPLANAYIKMINTAKSLTSKFFPYFENGLEITKSALANELGIETLSIDQLKAVNKDSFMHMVSQKQEGYVPSPFAPLFSKQWEDKLLTGDNNIAVQFRNLLTEINESDDTDSIRNLITPGTTEYKFFSKLDEHEDNSLKDKTTTATLEGLRTMLRKTFHVTSAEKNMIRNLKRPKTIFLKAKKSSEFASTDSKKTLKIGNVYYNVFYKGERTVDSIKSTVDKIIETLALKKVNSKSIKVLTRNGRKRNFIGKTPVYIVEDSKGNKYRTTKSIKDFIEGKKMTSGKQKSMHVYSISKTENPEEIKSRLEETKETDRYQHKTLSFDSSFAYSKEEKDAMTQGLLNMLTHENEKVREFAKNLVYYHILSRGFDNGVNAFMDMIPNEVWNDPGMSLLYKKDEEGNLVQDPISFNEYVREFQFDYFKDPKFFNKFIENFIVHRSSTPFMLKKVKTGKSEIEKLKNGKSIKFEGQFNKKLGLFPKFLKTLVDGKFVLLMRSSASGETSDARYVLYKGTPDGKVSDMWRIQRYNIEKLKDKSKLTSNKDRDQDEDQNFICAF